MLAAHIEELWQLPSPPRHRNALGRRAPRNRPRVKAGLALMRLGARLARPALRTTPRRPEVLRGW